MNQPAPAPAAPAAAPAAQPQPEAPPLYTAEETNLISEYEKNWPDVARAESLKRRAEYQDLLGHVFGQVLQYTQPLFDQLRTVGNTLHTQELGKLVPDYTPLVETEVQAWIDTQPSYLQGPYKQVMQGGTSEEVADLIGRYRDATGKAAPAAPQGQAPAPAPAAAAPAAPAAPAKSELSTAAKQAVASLAPVSGERSVIPQSEDKSDFPSAFDQYAAQMA